MNKDSERPHRYPANRSLLSLAQTDVGRRLASLAGLIVIVGVVVVLLIATGTIHRPGGNSTASGVDLENVLLLDTPQALGKESLPESASIGNLAPDFEISQLDDGSRVRLSDLRGQPVYINFWASWCTPCRAEMPDISELADRHPELLTIGVNRAEPAESAQRFLANIRLKDGSRGMGFVVNGVDPDDRLYRRYRGLGMPLSLFINTEGVVTFVHNGLLSLQMMENAFLKTADSTATTDN